MYYSQPKEMWERINIKKRLPEKEIKKYIKKSREAKDPLWKLTLELMSYGYTLIEAKNIALKQLESEQQTVPLNGDVAFNSNDLFVQGQALCKQGKGKKTVQEVLSLIGAKEKTFKEDNSNELKSYYKEGKRDFIESAIFFTDFLHKLTKKERLIFLFALIFGFSTAFKIREDISLNEIADQIIVRFPNELRLLERFRYASETHSWIDFVAFLNLQNQKCKDKKLLERRKKIKEIKEIPKEYAIPLSRWESIKKEALNKLRKYLRS